MKKTLLLICLIIPMCFHAQNFWTEVIPFSNDVNLSSLHMSIVDENIIWVSGTAFLSPGNSQERWSYSSDGGYTWNTGIIDLNNPDLVVSSISALSANKAYVSVFSKNSGSFGGVWITEDSGTTWTNQPTASFNSSSDSFANFIHFWDNNTGVVVGDPVSGFFEIYTTMNGGTDWNPVQQLNIPLPIDANEYALTDKYETQGNSIRFATTFGRIFTSDDFGVTWSVTQAPIPDFGGGINGDGRGTFSFKNTNEGLLVTNTFNYFRTINGGLNWTIENTTEALRNYQIYFVPETNNTYFSIGGNLSVPSDYGSSYSLNGGLDWINLNDVDDDPVMPNVVKFKSGTVGFCLGRYTNNSSELKFFKLTDPLNRLNGALATTHFNKNEFTATPNPIHDFTKINGKDIHKISIADLQGKILFTQTYSISNAIDLDLSSFQKGVYFAKIVDAEGNYSTLKILKN